MKRFNHNGGKYFVVNGAKIYVEEIGNRMKPALLMLHGGFETIENMNTIVEPFLDRYRIIGIDTRGHGMSELGENLSYEQIQLDVEAILAKLEIKKLSIIGFSDGAMTGIRIASSKRVEVDKLVAIGLSWSMEDVEFAKEAFEAITPESAREFFPGNYNKYIDLNPDGEFNKFCNSIVDMWLDKKGYIGKGVEEVEADTLLIRGDNDYLVSLASYEKLQSLIKGSKVANIPFGEHEIHREEKEVVNLIIKKHLEER